MRQIHQIHIILRMSRLDRFTPSFGLFHLQRYSGLFSRRIIQRNRGPTANKLRVQKQDVISNGGSSGRPRMSRRAELLLVSKRVDARRIYGHSFGASTYQDEDDAAQYQNLDAR